MVPPHCHYIQGDVEIAEIVTAAAAYDPAVIYRWRDEMADLIEEAGGAK